MNFSELDIYVEDVKLINKFSILNSNKF